MMLNKILLFKIAILLSGCDELSLAARIANAEKENNEQQKVYNITFNDRLSGVYYKPNSWNGVTVITDKQTGREYMYYDKTVIELKP